jgi:TPR repeat protein
LRFTGIKEAIEKGHDEARCSLACYEVGRGTKTDMVKALSMYRQANHDVAECALRSRLVLSKG